MVNFHWKSIGKYIPYTIVNLSLPGHSCINMIPPIKFSEDIYPFISLCIPIWYYQDLKSDYRYSTFNLLRWNGKV